MLILFSFAKTIPFLVDWENKFFDMQVYFSTPQKIDPRILLLTIDEATLASDPTPLPGKADEIGRLLNQIIRNGAAGIAIDLLLPDQWNQSEEFTRFIVEHPEDIAAAAFSTEVEIIGTGFVTGPIAVTLGPDRSAALFGIVNVQQDRDGIVRRFRASLPDSEGHPFPSFAFQAARLLEDQRQFRGKEDFWINYSVHTGSLEKISWKDLTSTLEHRAEVFRNRLVLLGAEYAGSGDSYTRIPHPARTPDEISGLTLQ
jgi:CHASE2 domain-containing sensor protein